MKYNLRDRVKQVLTDPIFNVECNFSIETSKTFYNKWEEAWNNGMYSNNPAVKTEKEIFEYKNLEELMTITPQAKTFYDNIKNMPHCKNVKYRVEYDKIIVEWGRLKTFDEWLSHGLRDALLIAYGTPEDGARLAIEKELGTGIYSNADIHLFAEGIIDEDTLKRVGSYERFQRIEGRDIEKDIEEAKGKLKVKSNVTVLTLKMG